MHEQDLGSKGYSFFDVVMIHWAEDDSKGERTIRHEGRRADGDYSSSHGVNKCKVSKRNETLD
ncbi:hypothetical protein J6590_082965 [Homalodisca vitripennis]|nr:hypothetical protein J6590_082965 [Homalodisca vitripennis]